MQKTLLLIAGFTGVTAVAFGAFGAHTLRGLLSAGELSIWEKGVQYQMYHALGIFLCYLFLKKSYSKTIRTAGICFSIGILFFSGSLYLLATRQLTGISPIFLGPITPIGGLFFLAGWSLIFLQALREERK